MTFDYHDTHTSVHDGSSAMLVSQEPFVLINEDGYAWLDDPGDWRSYVTETHVCKHCCHGIGQDENGTWVAPDAGFDVENGDGIWREICPDNDDHPNPPHEPEEQP